MGYLNTFLIKRAADPSPRAVARFQAQAADLGLTDPNQVNSYVRQQHQLRTRLNRALPSGINDTRQRLMAAHDMTEAQANRVMRRVVGKRSPGQYAQDIDSRGVANHARRQAFFDPDSIRNGESLNSKNVKQLGNARAEYARRLAARNNVPNTQLALPAPANTPVSPVGAPVEIVDDVPQNVRNVSSKVRPAGAPVTPTPAPTTTAIVPHQAPAATPAPANKSINYARRTWNSAKDLGRNAMGMGKQGFNAMKVLAKRNPKIAALMAVGGTLFGGSLLAGAASSGRPPVRQSNANNPYAGLETY
jgi:hypothetical protein